MGKKIVKAPLKSGVAKVPVVMQMEALECGAACLCMILAYYGKWIPLEQSRKDCGISRDGSKASYILRAARGYGLEAKGYRFEPEELRERGTFPCIIHWEFNHFVVCTGFKGNKVCLNDPARGNYTVSMERFDEAFTGVCIQFAPGEGFEPSGKQRSMFSFALKRLKGTRSAVLFVVITAVIASLAGIISTGFSRVFLDKLLTGDEPGWVTPFFIGLGLLVLLQLIAAWIQAVYSFRLEGKLAVTSNVSYMWKVMHLPMEFFGQRMAGDIQIRKEANSGISIEIVDTLAPLAINMVMMIVYFVVMLRYSWILTLIGVIGVSVNLWLSWFTARKRVNITRVMLRDQGKLASSTVSGIEMIETIKANGAESGFFEKWSGYQASVNTQNVHFLKLDLYFGMLPEIVTEVMNILVLAVGVWLVMQGEFTSGMIMAFQGLMFSFLEPTEELVSAGRSMQEMRSNMERIEDVMEYPEDTAFSDAPEGEALTKPSGHLTMRNVTFGYSAMNPPLIENFNLELKPGDRVALVGTSGCGKSTVSKLISGLYQPWAGEILLDGKPINQIDRSVFKGSVAVVDQDIILFEDTIANNIKMWDNSIEDFEMILAARDAQIHEVIMQRDGGYQYKMKEGGKDFSGGQRQRLEIARVLAQDPTIIIMDEATSALDAKTEYEVVNAIHDRGVTCIVIAHRLSTVRDCNEIIVLDKGKVIERGTHDELIAKNGVYKFLVNNE